jgi:hypothetical protein
MDTLLMQDSYECYYAGRTTGFRKQAAAAKPAAFPEKRVAISRERMLPVRLADLKTIGRSRTS